MFKAQVSGHSVIGLSAVLRGLGLGATLLVLSGCSALSPELPSLGSASEVPQVWNAPLPKDVAQVNEIAQVPDWRAWWQGQSPTLLRWIEAAQTASPNLAMARARVLAARAEVVNASNAILPSVEGGLSTSRGRAVSAITGALTPANTSNSLGVHISWALDILKIGLASRHAEADHQDQVAAWHAARSLVAAEVGRLYYANISCVQLAGLQQEEKQSASATVRIQGELSRVGLTPLEMLSLAQAALANSESRWRDTVSRCTQTQQALAALTGLPQAEMVPDQAMMQQADQENQTRPAVLAVPTLPARLMMQRPDVQQAAMGLVKASSAVGLARADLLPKLRLSGSFMRVGSGSGLALSADLNTWNIGPLSLSLPLFNRSGLHAAVDTRLAQWEAAQKNWSRTLRTAVQEVESSMVALDALQERWRLVRQLEQDYQQMQAATAKRAQAGLASPLAREEALRARLTAQQQRWVLLQNLHEAQIQLYMALGAGYDAQTAISNHSRQ